MSHVCKIAINKDLVIPDKMNNEESKLYARAIVRKRELEIVLAQINAMEARKRVLLKSSA